jgi:hypothetical protein
MQITIKNINEAFSNQNKEMERKYVTMIFGYIKDFIENKEPKDLFNNEISKQLPSSKKLIKKVNHYNKEKNILLSIMKNVIFNFIEVKPKQTLSFLIDGEVAKESNTPIYYNINVNFRLSLDKNDNIQYFKRLYPKIISNITEVVKHELVHLNQFLDTDKLKRDDQTRDKLDFSSEFGKMEKENMYSRENPLSDNFLSLDELEAYSKGLVTKYIKSSEKEHISFSEYVSRIIHGKNVENLESEKKIRFFEKIIQYVSKTFPKINLKDYERQLERLKLSLSRNNDKARLSLINPSKSS